jgi:hypothetical protein
MRKSVLFLLLAFPLFAQEPPVVGSMASPGNWSDAPVTATVDINRVYTTINNAPNADGAFQAQYTSTVFNLFLYQREIQVKGLPTFPKWFTNVQVGFETMPQTGGTTSTPTTVLPSGFDPKGITTATRIYGTVTFGLATNVEKVNHSIRDTGPFLDLRLFDYIKNDNVKGNDRSGSYRLGWAWIVPVDEGKKNVIEMELAGAHDKFFVEEPNRFQGRIRYNLYPAGSEANSIFLEFSYNRSMHSNGPLELKYLAGIRLNVQKVVTGLLGID